MESHDPDTVWEDPASFVLWLIGDEISDKSLELVVEETDEDLDLESDLE